MPYTAQLQPREQLHTEVYFHISEKSEPFAFAASPDALYLPGKKLVVVSGDPYYFQRIPAAQVEEVRVAPIPPFGVLFVALLFVAAAIFAVLSLEVPGATITWRGVGCVLAALVGGVLTPLGALGRHRLLIRHSGRCFRWDPPFVVDARSKGKINAVLDEVLRGCALAGVLTEDLRSGTPATPPVSQGADQEREPPSGVPGSGEYASYQTGGDSQMVNG